MTMYELETKAFRLSDMVVGNVMHRLFYYSGLVYMCWRSGQAWTIREMELTWTMKEWVTLK